MHPPLLATLSCEHLHHSDILLPSRLRSEHQIRPALFRLQLTLTVATAVRHANPHQCLRHYIRLTQYVELYTCAPGGSATRSRAGRDSCI